MSPSASPGTTAPGHGLLASAAIAAGALLLLLLLPQRVLHGVDSNYFAIWLEHDMLDPYPRHLAYLHFCGLVHAGLQPWGCSGLVSLRVAAAIGTAFGLFASHRALRLLPTGNLPGPAAGAIAILLLPAWFFFGSCAETSGVFAAGVGLCWWMYARWQQRPSLLRAMALGSAGAVAGALHAFGHLLTPGLLVVAWLQQQGGSWRHLLRPAIAALLAHGALAVTSPLLLGASGGAQASDALGHLQERWATLEVAALPAVLWREWLLPYGPWSLLALAALLRGRRQQWAYPSLLLLALHLPLAVLLLGHHQIDESGAYMMALGLPAILATMELLPRRAFWPCTGIATALLIRLAGPGWQDPVPPGFGAGIAALQAEQPATFVLFGPEEMDAGRTAVVRLLALNLAEVLDARHKQLAEQPDMGVWFDGHAKFFFDSGTPLIWSERSSRFFADSKLADHHRFWHEHLPTKYELQPVQREGFTGILMRRR